MTKSPEEKLRLLLLLISGGIILATLVFIFGNSLLPPTASSEISNGVLNQITAVIGTESAFSQFVITYIRKIAHFSIFSLLAIETALFRFLLELPRRRTLFPTLFFGLAVAVTDEALQILSKRGSSVGDILIDFSGFLLWTLLLTPLYLLFYMLREKYRAYRQKANENDKEG